MHLHILGICGTFMGGLAVLARAAGHRVTGCDANVYPPMSDQLRAEGVDLVEGYGADQIAYGPDFWVIGNVVTRGNPLMEAILDRGDRFVSGPQWLAEHVLHGRRVLAVAGTHGKTTTASMLAWILEHAGQAPGFLIGGVPANFGISARLGSDRAPFVIEADEYDTAFFDKRSKFLHYRSETTILNNVEFDHADIFGDLAAIVRQFHHFVRTLPAHGLIVANGDDPVVEEVLAQGCWTPVERFGARGEWQERALDAGRFDILHGGERVGTVDWALSGAHNRANALAAIAAARHAGVPPEPAAAALGAFRNVKRRMEVRGTVGGVTVYDDFAHHPTAIAATIAGLRSRVNGARIVAVLEPRSNTMKLGVMKAELAQSLAAADRVYCYAANLGWDAAPVLAPLGARASCHDDLDTLVAAIAAESRAGDHVLVMSNGGFGGLHAKLLEQLAQRPAA